MLTRNNPITIKVLDDYLKHIQKYLATKFSLTVDILQYPLKDMPTKYPTIIFVQRVEPLLYKRFVNTPNKPRILLLNTEQATVPIYSRKLCEDIQKYKIPVLDYSMENIAILQKKFPSTKFIHFPFPFTVKPSTEKTTLSISLKSSPHRKQVCQGIKIPVADFNNKWGSTRDALIAKSKVLINVHYKLPDYRIFESIRCYHALSMRTLVLSEPGVDNDQVLLKDFIIFCPTNKMQEKLHHILANYQEYYNERFSPEAIAKMEDKIYRIYQAALLLILQK